jgi:hypothetical protein
MDVCAAESLKINKSKILRSDFLFWTLQNHSINIFGRNYRKKNTITFKHGTKVLCFQTDWQGWKLPTQNHLYRISTPNHTFETYVHSDVWTHFFLCVYGSNMIVNPELGWWKKNQQGNAVCLAGCSLVLEHDLPFMVPHVEFSADHL